jgi:hypothetical protein
MLATNCKPYNHEFSLAATYILILYNIVYIVYCLSVNVKIYVLSIKLFVLLHSI